MRTSIAVTALILAASAIVGAPRVAAAEPHTMLVCFPGGPGSTSEATERLRAFFSRLEAVSGLKVEGEYHTAAEACERYIKQKSPDIAMFPYSEFVRRSASLSLVPVAQVTRKGRADNRYYLVAKKGATVAALSGKKLMTAHVADLPVIDRAGFGAKVDIAGGFTIEEVASSLKAIKSLLKGQADAILLDANEYASLSTLPAAGDLEAIATSDPLPGAPVVVIGEGAAIAQKLREALPQVCEEAKACEAIEVEKIEPADASTYKALMEAAGK